MNSENTDSDSISTETSNCDPSSAETDDHDGKQTGSLEGYGHGSTEISDCRSSSVAIDDHDNAENVDRGSTVINSSCSPCCGNTETDDYSRIESDICENNIVHNVGDDHHKDSPPSTPLQKSIMPAKRSPLAELLVYPTPTQRASKTKSCARVLTSAESITMLEEKARKKREEQEEKERKKKDRELKKAAREEEKKRKAQERQAKQAEKQAEKQKKAEQKKSSGQKRNNSLCDGSRSKRQKLDREDESQDAGIQHHEILKDECAACFGLFEDDADSVEWIECTNENCRVWAHAECLEMCDNAYVCIAYETLLV